MRRRQFILSSTAALYFGAVIGVAFVPGSPLNCSFWCWMVLLFLPVGTLLVLLMGRRRWWAALGFGVLGAAWIEAAQSVWMPVGYADALDAIWGSAGVTVGVLLAVAVTTPPSPSLRTPEPRRIVGRTRGREIPQD